MEKAAGSKTSVHIGCFTHDHETLMSRDIEMQGKYLATGSGSAMIANRVSWFYNLRGVSAAIDSACSSSLLALHLACQGLRDRSADMVSCTPAEILFGHFVSNLISHTHRASLVDVTCSPFLTRQLLSQTCRSYLPTADATALITEQMDMPAAKGLVL